MQDIAPPPTSAAIRKRTKRQRYRRNLKNKQQPAPPAPSDLSERMRSRIDALAGKRKPSGGPNNVDLSDVVGKHGQVSVTRLLDKLGVTDEEVRAEVVRLLQNGKIKDLQGLQRLVGDMLTRG